jgi:hypothetical protein
MEKIGRQSVWRARPGVGNGEFHAHQSSPAWRRSEWRQSDNGSHKRGLHTKLHVVIDKVGHPLKVIATEGIEPDYKRALELVASLDATCVLADKAYDADEIIFSHAALFPSFRRRSTENLNALTIKISTKSVLSLKNFSLK